MRIILLGAPGSGKGTQAKLICENFNIPNISTGDIFRSNIERRTSLGIQADEFIKKGELVTDDLTISMIEDRINMEDCRNGFLLDGFPRNINQAESLEGILKKKGQRIDRAIFFYVPEHILIERLEGRQVCKSCGLVFNSKFNKSKVENRCDICNGVLIKRQDDNERVIKRRIEVYINSINPILDHYGDGGPLLVVNGYDDIKNIYNSISKNLKSI